MQDIWCVTPSPLRLGVTSHRLNHCPRTFSFFWGNKYPNLSSTFKVLKQFRAKGLLPRKHGGNAAERSIHFLHRLRPPSRSASDRYLQWGVCGGWIGNFMFIASHLSMLCQRYGQYLGASLQPQHPTEYTSHQVPKPACCTTLDVIPSEKGGLTGIGFRL